MHSGLTYLGKHSYKDFGITMAHVREIGIPDKKKAKQSLPFSSIVYDYSDIFGSQAFEERPLKYTFNIAGRGIRSKDEMNWVKTALINWLMNSKGKQPLYDPFYPGVHFLAEIEGASSFNENWDYGFLEVTFTAYPFMISNHREGTDIWDDFNFLVDVSQETKFKIPGSSVGPYKLLPIGSSATIAAWATATWNGSPGALVKGVGMTGTITARRTIPNDGTNPLLHSYFTYDISGIEGSVLEQDIIQALTHYEEITMINNGTPSILPELNISRFDDGDAKVTIHNLETGLMYNFLGNNPNNYLFHLNSGENNLRLYGRYDHDIEFIFTKELI